MENETLTKTEAVDYLKSVPVGSEIVSKDGTFRLVKVSGNRVKIFSPNSKRGWTEIWERSLERLILGKEYIIVEGPVSEEELWI